MGHSEAAALALLLSAVAGLFVSIAGVNRGWGQGEVHDLKPKWGPWGPGGLGMGVAVQLGWWNSSATVESAFSPEEIEIDSDKSSIWGALVISVFACVAAFSLYSVYQVAAAAWQLPLKLKLEGKVLAHATSASGVAVLLLSIALYAGLARGAHNAVKDQFEQFQIEVDLWAMPGWAFAAAMISGVCLLAVAPILGGLSSVHAGYEYIHEGLIA